MSRIYYTAEDYVGAYQDINTTQEESILCKKLDLYRSIITVGNPYFFTFRDIRNNGLFRTLSNSILQKILLVQANIESNQNHIRLHPSFNQHVSDQKRIVSYNLGMAVAKLYAEKLLKIPNLTHVESLKKAQAITFVNQIDDKRPREPDLVGKTTNGDWHVFESKGSSNVYLNTVTEDAKMQARQIETIHGNAPSTISACATSFTVDRIFSKIVDPPNKGDKKIEIDLEKFYENYYKPFFAIEESLNLPSTKTKINSLEVNSIEISIENLNLTIGLETEVYELFKENNFAGINEYYKKLESKKFESEINNSASIGLDGFVLKYTNH